MKKELTIKSALLAYGTISLSNANNMIMNANAAATPTNVHSKRLVYGFFFGKTLYNICPS